MLCSRVVSVMIGLVLALGLIAVPGPDSTAIAANVNDPESVALAEAYRSARDIPRAQMCLLDLPAEIDLTLADYRALFLDPFVACLGAAIDRIEAVVLIRGVPLRVAIPIDGSRSERVSLAAALAVWRSTTAADTPVLGEPPGNDADCGGTPCYAARWQNVYRRGAFRAGYAGDDRDGNHHRPLLVTMLHGRSYEDAARLYVSALDAETSTAARGSFVFMEGADPARGALDFQFDRVISGLAMRGFDDAMRIPFDRDRTGLTMAAFFVGTAGIGTTIEANTFLPGSLVDNLTSYGAVPENFAESGEMQVSIARFVARGVAGAHGTTDEPLNNCFPARDLLLDYVDGFTLGEAYFSSMPFVYWRNLVLGDVMAAPYAVRPVVEIDAAEDGHVIVTAIDPLDRGIASLALYVDGASVAASARDVLEADLVLPIDRQVELLAVAQARGNGAQSKGWRMILARGGVPGPPDAGILDSGNPDTGRLDSGIPDSGSIDQGVAIVAPEPGGCDCTTASRGEVSLLVLIFVVLFTRARAGRPRAEGPPTRRTEKLLFSRPPPMDRQVNEHDRWIRKRARCR
jgi:hypothetical protein